MAISRSQLDRLGDRLRVGRPTDGDLRQLDEFRRSFSAASEHVVGEIRRNLGLDLTARPAKSTASLIDKLKRESVRLTQIQDIAGCRIVVPDIGVQERTVRSIALLFDEVAIVDRREKPSYGYRAVHVIARVEGLAVEVQVRTLLQHRWAEFSEKWADRIGFELKYGGGPQEAREMLEGWSTFIADNEALELKLLGLEVRAKRMGSSAPEEVLTQIEEIRVSLSQRKREIEAYLRDAVTSL